MSDYSVFLSPSPALAHAAARYTGLPPDRFQTARKDGGKPYFPLVPNVHFSISHSGDYWACAFGPAPVGLDLQKHQPCRSAQLAERFFHPQEALWLKQRQYRDFFQVWTAKESYVKFTGAGILDGLDCFSVLAPPEGVQFRQIPFLKGYDLCLCAQEIGEVVLYPLSNP